MINDALEFLAKQMENVVLYDADGNPSWYVPFYKCRSSELDASLPGHTHPAFIINGKEVDRILIGKYMACEKKSGGALYSIPGAAPRVSMNYDNHLKGMRTFKAGASGITIADHGLILLMAQKYGWVPKGNNQFGVDYRDGTRFTLNQAVKVDDVRVFRGWEYKCLVAHTTSEDILPNENPGYWQRGEHVGGTPVESQYNTDNARNGYNTLTGSGPLSWCLGNDYSNLVDIQGNAFEEVYGYRVFNGEIQIMKDNDAADPDCDFSAKSTAWKAIRASTTDDTFTLVEPGTVGTLKWNKVGAVPQLDTAITLRTTGDESMGCNFKDLKANEVNVPHVPYILRELGIFPTQGSKTEGYYWLRNHEGQEYMPRRGGSYINGAIAGLGCLDCSYPRSAVGVASGARGRFME